MTRRRVLLVLARGFAGLTAGALGSRRASAAGPAQRVVRLGFVVTDSSSARRSRGLLARQTPPLRGRGCAGRSCRLQSNDTLLEVEQPVAHPAHLPGGGIKL